MIKAMIFDIDGTLVHTKYEYIINTVKNTILELGTREVGEKEIIKFWFGMDRDAVISSWSLKPQDFWKAFYKNDKPEIRKIFTAVYDDVWVLKKFKEQNIKIAALTNALPRILAIHREKLPIEFDCIVSSLGDNVRPKPDPHGIEECMRLMGTKKEETIMVGNGLEDHLAAKAAGIRNFFIDRNEHSIEIPSENKISSLAELLAIVNSSKAY